MAKGVVTSPILQLRRSVEDSLLRSDGIRYWLLAWCVMPSHVHVLVEMPNGWRLPDVVQAWKSFTAHEASVRLGREGAFWQREYHDRFIRDAKHLAAAKRYIEENPVAARLVAKKEDWRSSSAWSGRVVANKAGEDAGAPSALSRAPKSEETEGWLECPDPPSGT